jgi:hypothetical protein
VLTGVLPQAGVGRAIALKDHMKRFLLSLTLLASFSSLAHADTVNLSTQPWSYSGVYSFPAGSNYAPYYGKGLVYGETYNSNGWNVFEAWGGTTVGNITHFTNIYASIPDFSGTFSNATFNSHTDVLFALFVGSEFVNGKWSPFSGHITETLNLNGGRYTNGAPWSYTYQGGTVTSASISSVPEPGSLMLMGTGLVGIAGAIRRKLVRA